MRGPRSAQSWVSSGRHAVLACICGAELTRQQAAVLPPYSSTPHTHTPAFSPPPPAAEEDRKERRRRLGLPEELTEEEKEEERRKAAVGAACMGCCCGARGWVCTRSCLGHGWVGRRVGNLHACQLGTSALQCLSNSPAQLTEEMGPPLRRPRQRRSGGGSCPSSRWKVGPMRGRRLLFCGAGRAVSAD